MLKTLQVNVTAVVVSVALTGAVLGSYIYYIQTQVIPGLRAAQSSRAETTPVTPDAETLAAARRQVEFAEIAMLPALLVAQSAQAFMPMGGNGTPIAAAVNYPISDYVTTVIPASSPLATQEDVANALQAAFAAQVPAQPTVIENNNTYYVPAPQAETTTDAATMSYAQPVILYSGFQRQGGPGVRGNNPRNLVNNATASSPSFPITTTIVTGLPKIPPSITTTFVTTPQINRFPPIPPPATSTTSTDSRGRRGGN